MKLNKKSLMKIIFAGAMTYFGAQENQAQTLKTVTPTPEHEMKNGIIMSSGPQVVRSVQYGDFDNDTITDKLIITENSTQKELNIYFFKGNGDGTFTNYAEKRYRNIKPNKTIIMKNQNLLSISTDYFDKDKTLDLSLMTTYNNNKTCDFFFKGNGDGTFTNYAEKRYNHIKPNKVINW